MLNTHASLIKAVFNVLSSSRLTSNIRSSHCFSRAENLIWRIPNADEH